MIQIEEGKDEDVSLNISSTNRGTPINKGKQSSHSVHSEFELKSPNTRIKINIPLLDLKKIKLPNPLITRKAKQPKNPTLSKTNLSVNKNEIETRKSEIVPPTVSTLPPIKGAVEMYAPVPNKVDEPPLLKDSKEEEYESYYDEEVPSKVS